MSRRGRIPRRALPDLCCEADAAHPVCGIDEAGRGPWAGPVVAAAVILGRGDLPEGLDDSKRLAPARRAEMFALLKSSAQIGIGSASVVEIDALNILQASLLAMRRAVAALPRHPAMALVDGLHAPAGLPCPARTLIGGDGRSASVAAASVVAKVVRDRMMVALARRWPGYGWDTNMGYGTRAHAAGLAAHGVSPLHRRSFRPVHNMLTEETSSTP